MKIRKTIVALFATLLLTGCGASGAYDNGSFITSDSINSAAGAGSYKGDYSYAESAPSDFNDSYKENNYDDSEKVYEQKLVYTCNITLETLNYSDTVKDIKERIKSFNGFIESEYEYDTNSRWYYENSGGTMHLRITIRVPSDRYDDFINSLEGDGKITSKQSNIDNITRSYYETTALIDSLKIQEERLLAMLDAADTIDDMITVERRLTEVQSQLNVYNARLATYDLDVEFSTVNLNIDEVEIYTPTVKTTTFFDRLKNTLKDSWDSFGDILEGLLFFIIRFLITILIPVIIIFTPIVILIVALKKKLKTKRLKKKEEKEKK